MSNYIILTINPGSTSTKIAVFENEKQLCETTLNHSADDLSRYPEIADQFEFRKQVILDTLSEQQIDISTLQAVVGRGGLLYPMESGVYEINDQMKHDLHHSPMGEHASNLGGLIADDIARSIGNGARAFIVDPVVVDEMMDVARLSGHPMFERRSIFHALNQKAIARAYAAKVGRPYEELNLIVAHMGGGISVGAHQGGRVVDVNNALDGEGPFSPERSGTLPAGALVKLCFSGKYTYDEVKKMIKGEGGIMAYMGTNDAREVRCMAADGNPTAQLVLDAMCYNIAKYVGSMAVALNGKVDAILLTGGIAHSDEMMGKITERIKFIAPVEIYPGEDEMLALALGGLRVLSGVTKPAVYVGKAR